MVRQFASLAVAGLMLSACAGMEADGGPKPGEPGSLEWAVQASWRTDDAKRDGSADLVLTFRNVHNWMYDGYAEKAFADFYRALKSGGKLGVEEHRGLPTGTQDPKADSGYVQEAYVRKLAEQAGFILVGSSE